MDHIVTEKIKCGQSKATDRVVTSYASKKTRMRREKNQYFPASSSGGMSCQYIVVKTSVFNKTPLFKINF